MLAPWGSLEGAPRALGVLLGFFRGMSKAFFSVILRHLGPSRALLEPPPPSTNKKLISLDHTHPKGLVVFVPALLAALVFADFIFAARL
eukprot:6059403-Pyramimonas_sp.AAC.1